MDLSKRLLSKSFNFAYLLGSMLLLSNCQVFNNVQPDKGFINDPITGYSDKREISIGTTNPIKIDLHQPQSLRGNPAEVVILLHGGGWTSGDKSFLKPTVDMVINQRKNLAIVNMNYRLSGDTSDLLSLQLEDLELVTKYLILNADKYNIRKDKFRLAGFSAGGHIALTYAYLTTETTISSVIGVSAPTELTIKELLNKGLWPNVEKLIGASYDVKENEVFKKASPFYLASFRSPRTILVYGQRDDLVSTEQGILLANKLDLLRVPNSLKIIPQEGHEVSSQVAAQAIMEAY
jgi:acetyl esterase/lipase